MLRPTCRTIVSSLHLLECALCTQLTPGLVSHVALTIIMGVVVLSQLVLGCVTVCRSNFDSQTFRLTVLRQYIEDVLVQVTGIAALCD
jgi:hypothetical protein